MARLDALPPDTVHAGCSAGLAHTHARALREANEAARRSGWRHFVYHLDSTDSLGGFAWHYTWRKRVEA